MEITEGHLSVANAAGSHVPPALAGRDSDVETSSSFSDENRAAVVASSAIPSTQLQPPQQSTTTTVTSVSSPAASHGVAGDVLHKEAVKCLSRTSQSSGQSRSICFTVNAVSHFGWSSPESR